MCPGLRVAGKGPKKSKKAPPPQLRNWCEVGTRWCENFGGLFLTFSGLWGPLPIGAGGVQSWRDPHSLVTELYNSAQGSVDSKA